MKLLSGKQKIVVNLKEFPTHIPKTNNKVAPNKFWKINYQSIYNGSINTFSRAIVMDNMHKYVMEQLPDLQFTIFPLKKFEIIIKTVRNHGNIRRIKGKINWKVPKSTYSPTWDCDNLGLIWVKAINDAMTKKGMIPDDNVNYILGHSYKIEFVKDIKDREIIIKIEQ